MTGKQKEKLWEQSERQGRTALGAWVRARTAMEEKVHCVDEMDDLGAHY